MPCQQCVEAFDLSSQAARWLELDESLRLRLELPRGWTEAEREQHKAELREREEVKRYIRQLINP